MIALPPSFAGGTNATDTELFPRVPTRPVGGPGTVAADATSASGIASIDATSRTQPTMWNFFTAPAPTLTADPGTNDRPVNVCQTFRKQFLVEVGVYGNNFQDRPRT